MNTEETSISQPDGYQVTAERDGAGWRLRVEGQDGRVATASTHSLDDVETAAWDLIAGCPDDRPSHFHVEVRLPPELRERLDRAEQLRADAARELQLAVRALSDAGLPGRDIDYLIGEHGRLTLGRQRTVVTNAVIARRGLDDHPNAVAVTWDDHGHFATLTCRSCVEEHRREYAGLAPDDENAIVYETDLYCDRCQQDIVP